jgi:hypothetical protein
MGLKRIRKAANFSVDYHFDARQLNSGGNTAKLSRLIQKVSNEPGLYFVGLHFLDAFSSSMIQGVSRDANYVADIIKKRLNSKTTHGNYKANSRAKAAAALL